MKHAAIVAGVVLILLVLWEGFESIILPRQVTRRFRLTRIFYRATWHASSFLAVHLLPKRQSETVLSVYGPLSILMLLVLWAGGLITGYALVHWGMGFPLKTPAPAFDFFSCFYFSGTTFFTLGLGDLSPTSTVPRLLAIIESGMGFGFLALTISYLPLLNQSFERREVNISMLDSRAGSPPTAAEMLIRHSHDSGMESLRQLLHDWERWSAEVLEGHLSYPVLAYFRSQHDNQSWIGALTCVLDTCALVMVVLEGTCARQAELTFAMARHAVVDLSLVFNRPPREAETDRLPHEKFLAMKKALIDVGFRLKEGDETEERLRELREVYEPYVCALAGYFKVSLPPWVVTDLKPDNWQVSGWERNSGHHKHLRHGRLRAKGHF